MLRRFLIWLILKVFRVDIVKVIKEAVYVQMKELVERGELKPEAIPREIKLKCTVRKFTSREGKTLEAHSICNGKPLPTPAEAREKLGTDKLISTIEETHLV